MTIEYTYNSVRQWLARQFVDSALPSGQSRQAEYLLAICPEITCIGLSDQHSDLIGKLFKLHYNLQRSAYAGISSSQNIYCIHLTGVVL